MLLLEIKSKGEIMGLFNDLFGNDKKKSQQAFGLFSFINTKRSRTILLQSSTNIYISNFNLNRKPS